MSQPKTCAAPGCHKPVAAKGLCITHYKAQRRGHDVYTREKQVGEPSGFGRFGIIDGDEHKLLCHECGEYFVSVAGHIYGAHGLRAREYKDRHGIPRGVALIAPEMAQRQSEGAKSRVGTEDWKKLEAARDPKAAAHARDADALRKRGRNRERSLKADMESIRGQRKRVHDGVCAVCGEPRGAGRSAHMTCPRKACELILRYRNRNGADGEMLGRVDRLQAGGAGWKTAAEGTGMSRESARQRVLSLRRHQLRVMGAVAEGASVDVAWWERPAGGVVDITHKKKSTD